MREVMELARAFCDVLFQLGLVRAQLCFRGDNLVRHRVDRFGERVDFRRATARRASGAIAGGQLTRGMRQTTNRARDADHQRE